MKTAFTYAAGMAIAGALTTFIFFFAGYHDAPEKFGTAQTLQTILAILITVVGLILGLRARRAELPAHEAFTYGRALGTGTLIAVFAAALGAFFQF